MSEEFSAQEVEVLSRYFSNTDKPIFAISNLPEIVKAGLFARYSRTPKSLRRLFLDEFYDGSGPVAAETVGAQKAGGLFERIFIEYGDDSVAQLGGAHLAVEGASNLLTKIVERPRLGGYLEQSTRYIPYDDKPDGAYRYHVPAEVLGSELEERYRADLDRIFDDYSAAIKVAIAAYEERFPRQKEDTAAVYRSTIKAKALDLVRGMLPASTTSNLGIFAAGQTFEAMLLRMFASPLAEARDAAGVMLEELRTVIPSFLKRVDQPDRGVAWSDYLRERKGETAAVVHKLLGEIKASASNAVELIDHDPAGERKVLGHILYGASGLPLAQTDKLAQELSADQRQEVLDSYVGERTNRRHRPGRAFEATEYTFDFLTDYGAFRDLQRHRMLSIQWQNLTTEFGFETPRDLDEFGLSKVFRDTMQRSAELAVALEDSFGPDIAQYGICMAHRIRYSMRMNARSAMHLIELRSSPQGHASYRTVAHQMHELISSVHPTIGAVFKHVDRSEVDLERLEAERSAERKRKAQAK